MKIAINGFGRIGRLVLRRLWDLKEYDVVAINDLTDTKTLAYLLKYDSSHGRFCENYIKYDEENIYIKDKKIRVFAQKDPSLLPWNELGIDIVVESTGFFRTKEKAHLHIQAGAKKVIISAPATGEMKTIVYNVNHKILTKEDNIISAASCTTNCLAPVVKILDDNFKLKLAYMTTIHSATNDQRLLDLPHRDLRRGRSALANLIPTTTGAAKAVGLVLPHLNHKLDGCALRMPTTTGSIVDLSVILERKVSVGEINDVVKKNANETIKYNDEPIVLKDIVGETHGSIFDATLTKIVNVGSDQMVKVFSWYDNEYSYVCQLVRTLLYIGKLI